MKLGNDHLESKTEELLRRRIRKAGGYAIKFFPVIAGLPDRLVFLPMGRLYLVELKQEGEKPRPIQKVWHARFAAIGFPVVVLDSKQAVSDWADLVADPWD